MDRRVPKKARSRVLHVVLGIWLLLAAILKVQADAFPGRDAAVNGSMSRSVLLVESGGEVLLGAWLVAGVWPSAATLVAIVFFAAVGFVAIGEALKHQASCGCFGKIAVPPGVTASLDLASIILLLLWRPKRSGKPSRHRLIFGVSVITIAAAGCLGMEMRRSVVLVAGTDSDSGQMDFGPAGSTVVLETTQWIGKRLSIAQHIDVWPQISHGRWVVLLVHFDCRHCMAAVDTFEADAANVISNPRAAHLAVIELPPYSLATDPVSHAPTLAGELDSQREWSARTPVALLLVDGVVRGSTEGDEGHEPQNDWWVAK